MTFPLPKSTVCYFCETVARQSDRWNVIDETDLVLLLLNGRQFEVGQCMVAPIRHAPTILDLNPKEEAAIMAGAKRLAQAMVKAYGPDGVLIYQNNGTGSGQELPHFHMHVVPRRAKSDWGLGPPHIARLEEQRPTYADHEVVTELKRTAVEEIRQNLGR